MLERKSTSSRSSAHHEPCIAAASCSRCCECQRLRSTSRASSCGLVGTVTLPDVGDLTQNFATVLVEFVANDCFDFRLHLFDRTLHGEQDSSRQACCTIDELHSTSLLRIALMLPALIE